MPLLQTRKSLLVFNVCMTSYITSELNKTTENNPGQKKKKKNHVSSFYNIDKALKAFFKKER